MLKMFKCKFLYIKDNSKESCDLKALISIRAQIIDIMLLYFLPCIFIQI